MPSSGIAGSYGSFIPSFLSIFHIVFHSGCINLHSHQQEGSLFSTPSPAFIVGRHFDDGHYDRCEVISHCSFDLHFSNNEQCWASFHVFISHLTCMCSLEKRLFRSFSHFLIGLLVFLVFPLFTAALFTIARTWKQPRCLSTDEWIKKCGTYIQWNITQP